MKVTKTILIPLDDEAQKRGIPDKEGFYGVSIMQVNTTYTQPAGLSLLQQYSEDTASDTFGHFYQRFSEDNGQNWSKPTVIFEPKKTDEGMVRRGESALFLDADKNAILQVYRYDLYPKDIFSGEVNRYKRLFYQISFNGGRTFTQPKQLIQKGFDENNWAKDVFYGRNGMAISFCAPIKTSEGKIILPTIKTPLDCDVNNPFLLCSETGCFIGKWKENDIEWDLSEMAKVDPVLSSRGLSEPAIAELSDGSLLMICRGSNDSIPQSPGYKWRCLSDDKGHTWSEVEPWLYDTGKNFFSPASGSRLIRSSKNHKLYWLGNINSENQKDGSRPRYPLYIAEVDEAKAALKKNTLAIIDDRRPEDSELVQLSNFRVYEDRETGEFVVTLARLQEKSEKDLSSPAYQYKIIIR